MVIFHSYVSLPEGIPFDVPNPLLKVDMLCFQNAINACVFVGPFQERLAVFCAVKISSPWVRRLSILNTHVEQWPKPTNLTCVFRKTGDFPTFMWVFWRVEASRENLLFFFRNPFSWDAKLHKLPMHFPYMRKESRKPRWARRSCIQHICASASWAYVFFANHP